MTTWTAPGIGRWELDRSHMLGGTTPIVQYIQTTSAPVGMRRVFRDLGMPADTLDIAFVNGFMYSRLRPLIGADKPAKKLPPAFVLKIATRVHPGFRRSTKTATRTMQERPWRQVTADWENGGRAKVEEQNLALQRVDLNELTDEALIAHVNATLQHTVRSWELHFWLHGFDLGPLGFFLFSCRGWGIAPAEAIPLLAGASPSTSEPMKILRRLRDAVEARGITPTSLGQVRALSPEAAADLDAYLEYRSSVLFSRYDLDGVTLGEIPEVVLATILNSEHREVGGDVEQRAAELRERVPEDQRDEFDLRLTEARLAMNLRDDNGPTTAEWPLGLLRLALIEVGARMAVAQLAHTREHVFELHVDELTPALLEGGGPSADELAARAATRAAQRELDPPDSFGDLEPPPPLEVLPAPLRRMIGTVTLVLEQMGMSGERVKGGLQGHGVGRSVYRGVARRADSPEEAIDAMEPGDVLVVPCTTPAYNVVLAIAGAVVTADGGPLSHAAVLARELDIPAVVGARGALTEIPDGAMVEVDAVKGEVRLVVV